MYIASQGAPDATVLVNMATGIHDRLMYT